MVIFKFLERSVEIGKFDPSQPEIVLNKEWKDITQQIFEQLEDSGKFSWDELDKLGLMPDSEFLSYIVEN